MTVDTKRLCEVSTAALPAAADVITAIRQAVEFYVAHWYETNGENAKLKQDGPVGRMLEFLLVANPQTVLALISELEMLRAATTRVVEIDADNCRHNRSVDPDTGECLDCGTVLP